MGKAQLPFMLRVRTEPQAQRVHRRIAPAQGEGLRSKGPVQQPVGVQGHLRGAPVWLYFFSMFQRMGQETAGVGFQLTVLRAA